MFQTCLGIFCSIFFNLKITKKAAESNFCRNLKIGFSNRGNFYNFFDSNAFLINFWQFSAKFFQNCKKPILFQTVSKFDLKNITFRHFVGILIFFHLYLRLFGHFVRI